MRWKASLGRNLTESAVGLAVTVLVLMVDSYHGFMGHDGSEVSPLYKIRTQIIWTILPTFLVDLSTYEQRGGVRTQNVEFKSG